jgi:hypothetical protein
MFKLLLVLSRGVTGPEKTPILLLDRGGRNYEE